jgi:RNA polymerase sigma-B factor
MSDTLTEDFELAAFEDEFVPDSDTITLSSELSDTDVDLLDPDLFSEFVVGEDLYEDAENLNSSTSARVLSNREEGALVSENIGLAKMMATRYSEGCDPELREEIFQEALIGLMHAVRRFDPDRGFRFSTFACRTIQGTIFNFFRDNTWLVNTTRRAREDSVAVKKVLDGSSRDEDTSIKVIAKGTKLPEERVKNALSALHVKQTLVSLDVVRDDGTPVIELAADFDVAEAVVDDQVFKGIINGLGEEDREIIRLRCQGKTQREIADIIGSYQVKVSRLISGLRDAVEGAYEKAGL